MQSSSTTHRIEVARGRTLVARVRPGVGTPVVFLHGLFSSSETWTRVCSELDRPSIAFDLPNFARAEDVAAAIQALGLERSSSSATRSAARWPQGVAELMPEQVELLVLLAPLASAASRQPSGGARAPTAVR